MPYTRTTEHTMAMCSGRDGVETVLNAVRYPEGCEWSWESASTGREPRWEATAVFHYMHEKPLGAVLTGDEAEQIVDSLVGRIVHFGMSTDKDTPFTRDEIAERVRPLVGTVRIDTVNGEVA